MFDLGGLGDLINNATNSVGDAAQNIIPDGIQDAIQPDALVDGATEQVQNITENASDSITGITENLTDTINPFN